MRKLISFYYYEKSFKYKYLLYKHHINDRKIFDNLNKNNHYLPYTERNEYRRNNSY